ncbi:ORFL110C.iORF1 [Human betaherpesvirus 5]|nr:ORFL110C.iORF1 [Human betaherpesvirus 5]QHX40429.1 ORFL110C.iORF1 [Human betaherpesvirus 5]
MSASRPAATWVASSCWRATCWPCGACA